MAVFYETLDVPFPDLKRRAIANWVKHVIYHYYKNVGRITYIFCSDDEILRINKQYLNHDYYTDIITFDYSEGEMLSGDLFISLDTVESNAEKFKVDYQQELYRVMIHGILHLCGFKDKTAYDKFVMRKKENDALLLLFQADYFE
jgi:rRNA maturation RNase YbeY